MAKQVDLEVTAEDVAMVVRPQVENPILVMIQIAVDKNYDIDKLERLLDLERRWKSDRAKEAYIEAMANFKLEDIHVTKDMVNKQYDSRYPSLGNMVGTVTPFLSKHGLSADWSVDQSNGIKVICTLTHKGGHSESRQVIFPADKSGSKNPLQEIKSAITYGKICTFENACGIASSNENLSDDGNGAVSGLDQAAVSEYIDEMQAAGDLEELRRIFDEAKKKARAAKDGKSETAFINAKDARKKKLLAVPA